MKTVAVVNQKGGVGKTTTVCNVGAALARRGSRVLLVDLDPQAHLTFHLGIDASGDLPTTYDLLLGHVPVDQAIVRRSDHLDLLPSHIDLAGAEIELVTTVGREQILRDALAACRDRYDIVLIDCPPSLGLLTLNALVATDEILITLQPHVLALQGMSKLLETAKLVRDRLNGRLRITGLVFCMFDGRTTLSSEVLADVESFFSRAVQADPLLRDIRLFQTRVRRNIKLAEAPGFGQSIFEYAPHSHGADDYERLAAEIVGESAAASESAMPQEREAADEAAPTLTPAAGGGAAESALSPAPEEAAHGRAPE